MHCSEVLAHLTTAQQTRIKTMGIFWKNWSNAYT